MSERPIRSRHTPDGEHGRPAVVVVRPLPENERSCAAIEAATGWHAIGVPVTQRRDLETDLPSTRWDVIAITSGASTQAAIRALATCPAPLHAIGSASANAAKELGAPCIVGGKGGAASDGADFASMLFRQYGGARVLYPCARTRTPHFERRGKELGLLIEPWPVYETIRRPEAKEELVSALSRFGVRALLLHAPSGARAVAEVLSARGGDTRYPSVIPICMSERVAREVPSERFAAPIVAKRPTEEALIAELVRL